MKRVGFTLIEVLLALAMTAALAAAMLAFTMSVADATTRAAEKTERGIRVDRMLHLLEEAMETPVASDPTPGAGREGGIRCDGTSIRVLYRGVREGVTEFSLRHDGATRRIIGRVGERPADMNGAGGVEHAQEEFASGIARFRVKCVGADGGMAAGTGEVATPRGADADESFDSARDGLPSGVVVEVWFAEGAARDAAEASGARPDRPADRTRWIRVIGGGR